MLKWQWDVYFKTKLSTIHRFGHEQACYTKAYRCQHHIDISLSHEVQDVQHLEVPYRHKAGNQAGRT